MKKVFLGMITLLVFLYTDFTLAQNIVINEMLASNNTSITDEDNAHQDWIELYNNGTTSVNLLNYGLSDDSSLPYKWRFPDQTLNPGEYLIVWASDKNRAVANSPLHTNFKISAKGNIILLTNPLGALVDEMPAVILEADMSYGRFPNGSGPFVIFDSPTPKAINAKAGTEFLSPPEFKVDGQAQESGFYSQGFDLTLSTTNSGTTILYTLDGSEPDENNLKGTTYQYKNQYPEEAGQAFGLFLENTFKTLTYSGPITITDRSSQPNKVSNISSTWDFTPSYLPNGPIYKGTVVKAKAIKPGALPSETVTKNYFISPKGANRFTIPVLSISADENLFFDYDNGIYVAGADFDNWRKGGATGNPTYHEANFGRKPEPEIVANVSYFVSGKEYFNQKVGIRTHGATSRVYPTKSLDLFARSEYGDGKMSYKVFPDLPYTVYERLTVKNGGSSGNNFMFRDELAAELVKDLPIETEAYQPIITFINGEYWGIMRLRERYDNNYFKLVYDIPSDQLDLLEDQGKAKEGDASDYNNMYSFIQNNSLAGSTNYNTIQTRMDTENYRDYFITNVFLNNHDWPGTNIIYWRKKTSGYQANAPYGHDGRWRWAIHDMDGTFTNPSSDELAAATDPNGPSAPNPAWSTLIIRKLLENDGFKIDFINRFADLMNTSFLTSRITARIDSMKAQIAPEMNDQYFRWKSPGNSNDWNNNLNVAYDFAKQRPDYQRTHIRQKFGISKNINVTLNVSSAAQGYIKINTINIIDGTPGISGNPYPWTGIYFHNIPLKLKAIAKPGFVFDHWTGASSSTQAEITITPTADFSITAVFQPSNISFSYTSPNVFTVGTAITNLTPSVSKAIDSYSISPTLSAGLNFNTSTGVISGTPTAVSPLTTYTVTANYTGGSITANIVITVNEMPPSKVTYHTPNVFTKNVVIGSLKPTVEGGAVTSYSISPGLPAGLSFNTNTGEISGTPTVTSSIKTYTVTANYEGGSLTSTLEITVKDIPPTKVTYNTPNVFIINAAISSLKPTIEGGPVTSYSIAPVLPTGLSFNNSTGEISGTPTIVSPNKTYTVTANYSGGSLTSTLEIRVNDVGINSLIYDSPNVFTINVPIANLSPTVTGGKVISYSIAPSLPAGLSFNTTTGTISGTPTVISPTTKYTVTAENSNGSLTVEILITVNDLAPNNLIYPNPNVFPRNVAITNLNPSISGGPVISYNVVPNLPTGLLLNPITGTISGLPTEVSELKTYIVTALNSGGSASFDLLIAVQDNLSVHDNLLSDKISVYPNPFSNSVNIAGIDAAFSYKVFTIEGKLISNATNSKNSIELSALPVGMYILQLSFDDRTVVKKIFKNK